MAPTSQDDLIKRGVCLLGCGKMGTALLKGWLSSGIPSQSISVIEPHPSPWLKSQLESSNIGHPKKSPAVCVIAVKPQIFSKAVEAVTAFCGTKTLILSIAAGVRLDTISEAFDHQSPVVRAMPNTPASIGFGISALTGNEATTPYHLDMAERLMSAVGETVRIERESQMDAVTALSGSGPAYIFYMIEAMTQAAIEQGLPAKLALKLAKSTVAGAGRLAIESEESPTQLREDVTSPAGTTESALKILMDKQQGLGPLMSQTISAAAKRSEELGQVND